MLEILSPGTEDTPAECRLETVSLVDDVPFTALSYVWGDPMITKDIILNGSLVSVTVNLANALAYVKEHWQQQHPDGDPFSFRVWIDAICINQNDVMERNQQVQIMSYIYSQAELVLAWLGSGNEEMCLALRSFETIAQEVKEMATDDLSFEWIEDHPSLCVEDDQSDEGIGNKCWTAMWHFFDLSYWHRVWTFQEIVLGEEILLIYGPESLDYYSLAAVCDWSRTVQQKALGQLRQLHKPSSMSRTAWDAATRGYIDWYKINAITLARRKLSSPSRRWTYLLLCRDLLATDPRDHIYGLLSIIEEGLDAKITPDYSKPVSEVYSQAIGHWIEEEQDLTFLYLAGIGRFYHPLNLPSWTPNFKEVSEAVSRWHINFGHADSRVFENHTDKATVLDSSLQAIGVEIDKITRVEEAPKQSTWENGKMLQYCINYLSRNKIYVTGVPPLQAIFHVLMTKYEYVEKSYSYEEDEEELDEVCPQDELENESIQDLAVETENPMFEVSGENHSEHQVSKHEGPETEASEEDDYHLLSLGFLKYLLFRADLDIPNIDRFRLLRLSTGDGFSDSFKRLVYPNYSFQVHGLPNLSTEFKRPDGPLADATRSFMRQLFLHHDAFRFVETARGYLGLAPDGTAVGDMICVLKACSTPVVLREVGGHYVHVGTCFVLGLMEGQAAELLQDGRTKIQQFEIS